MLRSLHIRDLAIIDELSLDWRPGFSVLTGETGAGKSILLDALGLALGLRGDATLVRSGREKAEVAAEFSLADCATARGWLAERELADGDDCVLRRVLMAEGRSRAFVNGRPVTGADLRELGEQLVEIFGQGDSRSLISAAEQRARLDEAGGHAEAVDAVRQAARDLRTLEQRRRAVREAQPRDPAQLEFLRFQLQELEALALAEDELAALDAEHRRLANAGRLLGEGDGTQQLLYGADGSVYDQLSAALQRLRGLVPLDPGLADVETLTQTAQAQVREAADTLRRHLERMDLDPERLAAVEARLAAIHELARKHRVRADELPTRTENLRRECQTLEEAGGALERLEADWQRALTTYRQAAAVLGTARRRAAPELAAAVTARIRELGMPNACFEIAVDRAANEPLSEQGEDQVRFEFSANAGQPPRPLAKVASGGELSRIALALQVSLCDGAGAPTMIFDEVDAGIGGATADIVGRQLAALGRNRQVLCVTHLAPVAARAGQHFAIAKSVRDGQTQTQVRVLATNDRVGEIARMLGDGDAKAANALARELISRSG